MRSCPTGRSSRRGSTQNDAGKTTVRNSDRDHLGLRCVSRLSRRYRRMERGANSMARRRDPRSRTNEFGAGTNSKHVNEVLWNRWPLVSRALAAAWTNANFRAFALFKKNASTATTKMNLCCKTHSVNPLARNLAAVPDELCFRRVNPFEDTGPGMHLTSKELAIVVGSLRDSTTRLHQQAFHLFVVTNNELAA